jgi:thymidylate synthase (FAD)
MKIVVERATVDPLDVISRAAGICYGKTDASHKRAERCLKEGHESVFEHASVTLRVEGVSRALMAQLTRHRLVSFCVESQRYNRYDLNGNDWYIVPPEFAANHPREFADSMEDCASAYMGAIGAGVKPEDARYLLPEATKTNLVMTCNCRELFHILDMRLDKAAQWEIRGLAGAIVEALEAEPGWNDLIAMFKRVRGLE